MINSSPNVANLALVLRAREVGTAARIITIGLCLCASLHAFLEHWRLTVAPNHHNLVAALGANEVGAQSADHAYHNSAEYRAPEAHHLKAIDKPASQVEHASIEDQQKQAEG